MRGRRCRGRWRGWIKFPRARQAKTFEVKRARDSESMDLFEYQAKELFAKHNVPTTPGRVTDTAAGAKAIAAEIGKPVMVKAQVKAGGRGKAGRRKDAATPAD